MSGVFNAFKHPGKAARHLIRNPASAIVPVNVRNSSFYRNVGRPIAKVGGAALGGGLFAGGLSAMGGGLTDKPFRPLPNFFGPLAATAAIATGAAALGGAGGLSGAGSGLLGGAGSAGSAGGGGGLSGFISGLHAPQGMAGWLNVGKNLASFGSNLSGFVGNKKVAAAEKAARDAALAGDMTAYQKAITELQKELRRAQAGATFDFGASGFVPVMSRGAMLGNIKGILQHDANLRRSFLGKQRDNSMARTRAAASAQIAQSRQGMVNDLLGGLQSGAGLIGAFI